MGFLNLFGLKATEPNDKDSSQDNFFDVTGRSAKDTSGIFKAYIPEFLYKPPYGYPRKVNTVQLRKLAKNPYIFSVIKTICDEITSIDYDIVVKDDFNDGTDYSKKIKEIKRFFNNPNGNSESFEQIIRQVLTDILEVDSGVLVKVFNNNGEFKQLFARDGSLFLKNPNIYGYMGDKQNFVAPLPDGFTGVGVDYNNPNKIAKNFINKYNLMYREQAAYFQYGWTAGSMPVPFGKREIVYFMQNPRSQTIYGRSPVEILNDIILLLIYGSQANLDFYMNNNMPEGVISLLGAKKEQITAFRKRFDEQFTFKDALGNMRKKFFKIPISSTEVSFTPFQLSPKDLEVISQQEWFIKLVWASFGVTAAEMGWTETVSKAVGDTEVKVSKRKAILPLLRLLEYSINNQILIEFFDVEYDEFGDVPLEFKFAPYDYEDDKRVHDILEQEIRMGVKTPKMAALELGIDINELEKSQEESIEEGEQPFNQEEEDVKTEKKPNEKKPVDKDKSSEPKKDKVEEKGEKKLIKELESEFDSVEKLLISAIDKLPTQPNKNGF